MQNSPRTRDRLLKRCLDAARDAAAPASLVAEREAYTQAVYIKEGATEHVGAFLAGRFEQRMPLVLSDRTTADIAGQRVARSLRVAGFAPTELLVRGTPRPTCDDETLESLLQETRHLRFDSVLTVGSGTITDLGKFVAQRHRVPLDAVATAPSMNGYTSGISAILREHLKQTVRTTTARTCIADPAILRQAPDRMRAAGVGDAYSRFIARADWLLSARLAGALYDPQTARLLDEVAELLRTIAPRWDSEPGEATADLFAVLAATGLAQQAAAVGTQASGSEHLFSHYWDMLAGHPDFDHTADLHGLQVGVGTLAAAHLYEQSADFDLACLANDHLSARWPAPEQLERSIADHFRGLAPAVLDKISASYPTADQMSARLEDWASRGESPRAIAMDRWVDTETLRSELAACGAPVTFAGVGVDDRLARDTLAMCRHVRDRFTILHLVDQTGTAEALNANVLKQLGAS